MDNVATILRMPSTVHDLDGHAVQISVEARAELLRLAQADALDVYQAGTDPLFFNLWLAHELDKNGYRGVRVPVAEWARSFDAREGGTAA